MCIFRQVGYLWINYIGQLDRKKRLVIQGVPPKTFFCNQNSFSRDTQLVSSMISGTYFYA